VKPDQIRLAWRDLVPSVSSNPTVCVHCSTREVCDAVASTVQSAADAQGVSLSVTRHVLTVSLGDGAGPRLSPEEEVAEARKHAATYGWEKRDWSALGGSRQRRFLVVVCAGDGWLDLCGREWLQGVMCDGVIWCDGVLVCLGVLVCCCVVCVGVCAIVCWCVGV
jgi:hypothetical protein